MAQGNILQGQGAGKLGDTVLMVRNGVQVARVYTKAGARSGSAASEASRIQRVRFGSASNQWSLYRYVCTRMYRKGKQGNQSDYNYFVKRNSTLLPYLTKAENAEGVHCLMPGIFSSGNLGRIELSYAISAPTQAGVSSFRVVDTQQGFLTTMSWGATVANLKAALASVYPNASKVTYLFSFAPVILAEAEGIELVSQSITHTAVTVELFSESHSGENLQTVAAYFASRFAEGELKSLLDGQIGSFGTSVTSFYLTGSSADHYDLLKNLSVMIFATDDNASDCYSTIIPADAVPPTNSAWSLYASYRTADALRLACESYGFQSGVMRDDIASWGNDLRQQQIAYTARMRSLGIDAGTSEE